MTVKEATATANASTLAALPILLCYLHHPLPTGMISNWAAQQHVQFFYPLMSLSVFLYDLYLGFSGTKIKF
jgi:hypothetical protein